MDAKKKRNCGPQKTFIVDGITLTECQMRIISLAVMGLYRKQMPDVLGVALCTIDTHFNRIYKLLGFKGGIPLATWALTNGFDIHGYYKDVYLLEGYQL